MRDQTVPVNPRELLFGSASIFAYRPSGDYVTDGEIAALVANPIAAGAKELGAAENVKFKETIEYITARADNCDLGERVKKQTANISLDWLEFSMERMNIIRGGIDTYTVGTPTTHSGATQTVLASAYTFNGFIPFANQSHDKAVPTSISVAAATAGALTADSDYYVTVDSAGNWGIVVVDGPTLTATETLTITYTWTEGGVRTLSSGGKSTMTPLVFMLRNMNEYDETVDIILYKAYYQDGMDVTYQSDEADKPNGFAINMLGKGVKQRPAGDQIFRIVDQRALA